MNDFNPSDLLHILAPLLDEGEAGRLRELVALLEAVGEEGDWTNDSYLVMSLASPAMEQRVLQLMAPTFAGEAGRLRRQEWDERREALKRELDLQKGGAAD